MSRRDLEPLSGAELAAVEHALRADGRSYQDPELQAVVAERSSREQISEDRLRGRIRRIIVWDNGSICNEDRERMLVDTEDEPPSVVEEVLGLMDGGGHRVCRIHPSAIEWGDDEEASSVYTVRERASDLGWLAFSRIDEQERALAKLSFRALNLAAELLRVAQPFSYELALAAVEAEIAKRVAARQDGPG